MYKSEKLLNWCRRKQLFNSAEIERWGIQNYYLRARRTVRDFVSKGYFKRLTDQEKISRNLLKSNRKNIAWYEVS